MKLFTKLMEAAPRRNFPAQIKAALNKSLAQALVKVTALDAALDVIVQVLQEEQDINISQWNIKLSGKAGQKVVELTVNDIDSHTVEVLDGKLIIKWASLPSDPTKYQISAVIK